MLKNLEMSKIFCSIAPLPWGRGITGG